MLFGLMIINHIVLIIYITDKKGKYNRGGIVKFAIFPERCNISNNIDKTEWVNDYDSVIYYKTKNINYAINDIVNKFQYPIIVLILNLLIR